MQSWAQRCCEVEKAVYYTRPEDVLDSGETCDRIYFGHEFCQRLLPSPEDLCRAASHAEDRGLGFTFVTPFVTNAGLKRVGELTCAVLDRMQDRGMEVVVNDWGVLHFLRREHPDVTLVLGRLLTKQKRGPRLLRIAGRMPEAAVDHFRRSNADVPHVTEFLKRMSVGRVELDNLLQGIRRNDGLPASLYHPYGYISTTRLCLMMRGDRPGKNLRSLGVCGRECRHYDVTLRHRDMPADILLKGNTQFFRNDEFPDDLDSLNINRLVYTPALPV